MNRSKVNNFKQSEVDTLIAGNVEKVAMSLNTDSAEAIGFLTQRLTELYENPVIATVRELTSNGIDATTIAYSGSRPEVRIVSPTQLSPKLIIEDNGVGMSYDELKSEYSRYGASTKATDLNQVGAYGLGAKSPLAYCDSFTVTSTKDGITTTLIVAREEITNYIKIVSSVETGNPSGTKITVPVHHTDIHEFNDAIDNYRNNPMEMDVDMIIDGEKIENDKHLIGTVNIKGVDARVWGNIEGVTGILTSNSSRWAPTVRFIIGGWPYEINTHQYRNERRKIYVELPAGVVDFTSSRDGITLNRKSQELEVLIDEFIETEECERFTYETISKMNQKDYIQVVRALHEGFRLHIRQGQVSFKSTDWNSSKTILGADIKNNGKSVQDLYDEFFRFKLQIAMLENETTYRSRPSNHVLSRGDDGAVIFTERVIADINKVLEEQLPVADLFSAMTILGNFTENSRSAALIITDVTDDRKDDIRKKRKALTRVVANQLGDNYTARSIFAVAAPKAQIEEHIELLSQLHNNITIVTIDEAIELAGKTKKKIQRKKSSEYGPSLIKVTADKWDTSHISEIDKNRHNVFILTPTNGDTIDTTTLIWYANKNNLGIYDFDLYISRGNHTVSDLEQIKELGVLIQRSEGQRAGNSKLYEEIVDMNGVGSEYVIKSSGAYELDRIEKLAIQIASSYSRTILVDEPAELNELYDKARDLMRIADAGYERVFISSPSWVLNLEGYTDEEIKLAEAMAIVNGAMNIGPYNDNSFRLNLDMQLPMNNEKCNRDSFTNKIIAMREEIYREAIDYIKENLPKYM